MIDLFAQIDELHRQGKFHGFSIWPMRGGYQVNLATTAPNNWRVRRADTPSEGTALVLAMNFVDERVDPKPQVLLDEEMTLPRDFEDVALAELEASDDPGIFD